MHFNWKQREVLVAIHKHKTQLKAAQHLGITQASLSLQLKEIEKTSDLNLFEEQGRAKTLTLEAIQLAELWSEQMHELKNKEKDILSRIHDPRLFELKVAGRDEILSLFYYELFSFRSKVSCLSLNTKDSEEQLLNGTIDAIISKNRVESYSVFTKKFYSSDFCWIVPNKYPKFINSPEENIHKLIAKPYISYRVNINEETRLNEKGVIDFTKVYRKFTISNWANVVQLVEQGFGWSLVPRQFTHNKRLRVYDIQKINTKYSLYFNYRKKLKRLQWFIEDLNKITSKAHSKNS